MDPSNVDRNVTSRPLGSFVSDLWNSPGLNTNNGRQISQLQQQQRHLNESSDTISPLNHLLYSQLNGSANQSKCLQNYNQSNVSPNHLNINSLRSLNKDALDLDTTGAPLPSSSSIFNFGDVIDIDHCSTNLSPVGLNHNVQCALFNQESQPLTRRHSDWIVHTNSSNLFGTQTDYTVAPNTDVKQFTTLKNVTQDYPCPNFNLIKALDNLYLSNNDNIDSPTKHNYLKTSNSNVPIRPGAVCPPGFEFQDLISSSALQQQQQQQSQRLNSIFGNHPDSDVWSMNLNPDSPSHNYVTNDLNSNGYFFKHLFNNANHTGSLGVQSVGSDLVDDESLIIKNLHNSIWSQSAVPVPSSFTSFSSLKTNNNEHTEHTLDADILTYLEPSFDSSQRINYSSVLSDASSSSTVCTQSDHFSLNSSLIINGRCGAIGEGRRRQRESSSHLMQRSGDNISMNVSSPLSASITEVA